ncbi:MAG TPA: hypothetical protein VLC10_05085 [Patescibacteria group bacterium]|nr:hypothetical protein [Patescibacteria group bacterium]
MPMWPFARQEKDGLTPEWLLRIAVCGEFIGHGVFAIQGKAEWVGWVDRMLGVGTASATQMLMLIGLFDIIIALLILLRPVRAALLWAAFWGLWTALLRPLMGLPIWDFVERTANWGAPLALLMMRGWPKKGIDWLD